MGGASQDDRNARSRARERVCVCVWVCGGRGRGEIGEVGGARAEADAVRRASWNSSPPNTLANPLFPARGTCNVPDSSRRVWWRRARTSRPGPSRRRWQTTSTTCWLALSGFLSPLPLSLNGAGSRLVPKNLEGRPAQDRICTCRDAIRRTIFCRKVQFRSEKSETIRGKGATRLTSKPAS